MVYYTASAEDTAAFGAALAAGLGPGDCVLLRGDLGAGKSVLARGVARGLGVTSAMPSPTFTLMQPYQGRCPVYHFDLYRLSDPDEFYAAGLDEYLGGDGVALIEWPQCADLEPESAVYIDMARSAGDETRALTLTFAGLGAREAALKGALKAWEAVK